jgi:hypothetical protein
LKSFDDNDLGRVINFSRRCVCQLRYQYIVVPRGVTELRGPELQGDPGRPIMCVKWGPEKAKLRAPEGPRTVVFGPDPAMSRSHVGESNRVQIAIR